MQRYGLDTRKEIMNISRKEFELQRTPRELQKYVCRAFEHIRSHPELVKRARLKREPYKTFLQELLPFSVFCHWKYGDRTDILCSLLPKNSVGDAVVQDRATGSDHLIEITYPIDGRKVVKQGRQLNARGMTDTEVWDYNDTAPHLEAVQRALSRGQEKSRNDYRAKGGSTLILVFKEDPYFWADEPEHQAILDRFVQDLRTIEFKVDDVVVLLDQSKRIIDVKSTQPSAAPDPRKSRLQVSRTL